MVRGEGAYLEDDRGRRYLDLMTNYGVNVLGHRHPGLTAALTGQLDTLATLHGSFTSPTRSLASAALAERLPIDEARLCWCNSGAEAIEVALKAAALATGRKRFIACRGGYHGKTLGALSATHAGKDPGGLRTAVVGVRARRVRQRRRHRRCHRPGHRRGDPRTHPGRERDHRAARRVPARGARGVRPSGRPAHRRRDPDRLRAHGRVHGVRRQCRGAGRDLPGQGNWRRHPRGRGGNDARRRRRRRARRHLLTFGGNPLACACALFVLSWLTPDALARIGDLGASFADRIASIQPARGRHPRARPDDGACSCTGTAT